MPHELKPADLQVRTAKISNCPIGIASIENRDELPLEALRHDEGIVSAAISQMGAFAIEQKVAFLSQPRAYGDEVRSVSTKQTHMSWVFLTETHAWKLKKPVRYDHLDFSTVEARRQNCEQEVLLNQRLAPEVYLGVVPVTVVGASLSIGGPGDPVDWLVQMRRLPDDRMLDRTIAHHTWTSQDVQKVGKLLGDFYKRSAPVEGSGELYRQRLSSEFCGACAELRRTQYGLPADLVDRLCAYGMEFMEQQPELFDERVRAGKIVDGHGDLRAEHICLKAHPVIIDCLEFNSLLRIVDSASELTFLKLECERLGANGVGERIFRIYRDETGDSPDEKILRFYKCYHACVRAKLALWHLRDTPDSAAKWIERAKTYLQLA